MSSLQQLFQDDRVGRYIYATRDVTFSVFNAFYHSMISSDVVQVGSRYQSVRYECMDNIWGVYSPMRDTKIYQIRPSVLYYVNALSSPSMVTITVCLHTEDHIPLPDYPIQRPISIELNHTWEFRFRTYTYTLVKKVRGVTKHHAVEQPTVYTIQLSSPLENTNPVEFQSMTSDLCGHYIGQLDWMPTT